MPTRDERRAEASKHLALMKGAFAKETQATIDAAVVYEDGDALALAGFVHGAGGGEELAVAAFGVNMKDQFIRLRLINLFDFSQ